MLKCILFNARSLGNKLLELHHLLYTADHDIVLVTESCLDSSITSALLDPQNKFCVIRNDRNRNGGGVCALVSKQIQICKVDVDKPFDHLEILCFDVVCHPSNLRFTLVYRPPSSGVESDACLIWLSFSNRTTD